MFPPRLSTLAFATLTLLAVVPAAAQQAVQPLPQGVAPEIRGVLKNSQTVYDRLDLAIGLTTPREQQQHPELKRFIEVFLYGVRVNDPVRMDLMTGGETTSYRLHIPVENFTDFWQLNLEPVGIPVQQFPGGGNLYKLGGSPQDAFTGVMMYHANQRNGYATIVEDASQLRQGGPAPTVAVANLLKAGYDLGLHLENADGRPQSVEQRKKHFAAQREADLANLKRDVDESAADFNFRKLATQVQFKESERLYAEAKHLIAGSLVRPEGKTGHVALSIEPLPETTLAKSVALLGQKPGRFSGVPRGENATTSGRIHFPLDDVRQKNLLELTKAGRAKMLDDAKADETATEEEKTADAQFINGFFDRIDAGLNAGVLDGFVEMTTGEGGAYTLVGAVVSPEATKWADVIATLPKTSRHTQLKMNIAEHGGFAIHEITIAEAAHAEFARLFGGSRLLLATGADSIWYAAGPDADTVLKQTIDQAAQPGKVESEVIAFQGELLPWIRILDQRLEGRGRDAYRDLAIESFQNGDGHVTFSLERKGDKVEGRASADQGVLRLIGKALAKFSAEQLSQ